MSYQELKRSMEAEDMIIRTMIPLMRGILRRSRPEDESLVKKFEEAQDREIELQNRLFKELGIPNDPKA